ncbi:MAG: hypothetical protein ACR2QK_24540 [Acidimicrobiales bacterium]
MTDTAVDYSVLATDSGHFTIAALDHRDALKVELDKLGDRTEAAAGDNAGTEADAGDDAVIEFKRDMLVALGRLDERPSAVMLEPEFALPRLSASVPDGVGVTCALEAQGYFSDPAAGNRLMDGWSPARVTEVGADGAKLLVLYRHDRRAFTEAQERLVAEVVDGAAEAGVPILIEPVPTDVVDDADRRAVILASAERLSPLGPMLLKLPYPGAGACADLTAACGDRPWALLSWGVPYEEYAEQLVDAAQNGCSGFTVGRALWREAVDPASRARFNRTVLGPRFAELVSIAKTGSPWFAAGRDTKSQTTESELDR